MSLLLTGCVVVAPHVAGDEEARAKATNALLDAQAENDRRASAAVAEALARRDEETARAHQEERAADQEGAAKAQRQHDEACAADRNERRAAFVNAALAANAARQRGAALIAYRTAHCRRRVVGDFERQLCDNGTSVARWCNVRVAEHHEWDCPATAPPELRSAGGGIPSGVVEVEMSPEMRRHNTACADVDQAEIMKALVPRVDGAEED